MEIVKLMIDFCERKSNGVMDWNRGLCRACEGGNMEIVKLMIEKGANAWDRGLIWACDRGHMEIVKLMIEKGATDRVYWW